MKHARQQLKKEIEVLQIKSYTYKKLMNIMDEEINNVMGTKYEKHPTMKEPLRNKWKTKCDKVEVVSSQLWEANVKSIMHTLDIHKSTADESFKEFNGSK